jgi:DinB superfamily
MARTRVDDVLAALGAAFEKNGWHGPTVMGSVRGVTAREAARKPPRAHHSIQELVDHIAYWEAVVLRRYLGPPKAERRGRGDWRPPQGSLAESVRRMEEGHNTLVKAVAALRDQDLDRKVPTSSGPRPLVEVLHGLAAHDAYHAGQIRLTRKLLRGR